jgi:hypothetical protein
MVLIECNSATRGVQDRIIILRVLFGLVVTQPSRVGDGAAKSVLAITRQGVAADRQGATIVRSSAAINRLVLPSTVRVSPSVIRVLPPIAGVPSTTGGCWDVAVDCLSPRCHRRLPKKALVMRGVDRGGHRSRHMDLHTCPHGGHQLSWFMIMI